MYVGICVYLYTYICGCTRMFMMYIVECIPVREYVCVSSCVWLRVAALRIRLVRSGPLQETRTRSGFVLVVDPIPWQFEDWFMRWSIDQYRFVQWRPDGDSVPKSRHLMWVYVLVYLPLLVCIYILHLSFHVTFRYILSVWLLVPLHETSMNVHFNYIVDRRLYQYHFMCW